MTAFLHYTQIVQKTSQKTSIPSFGKQTVRSNDSFSPIFMHRAGHLHSNCSITASAFYNARDSRKATTALVVFSSIAQHAEKEAGLSLSPDPHSKKLGHRNQGRLCNAVLSIFMLRCTRKNNTAKQCKEY